MEKKYDVVVVGAGTAGLSAAMYAARAGLSVCVIEKSFAGGQIVNSPEVENYPALKTVSGFDFVMALQEQAKGFGAVVTSGAIKSMELSGEEKRFEMARKTIIGKAVVIATGAAHRKLGIPGEDVFSGRGVSYCATCDGGFFKEKDAVVVGGGETAFEDALYLSGLCNHVTLIHRRDSFRAAKSAVDRLMQKENVTVLTETVPLEIRGEQKVEELVIRQKGEEKILKTDAVFAAVGMQPENQMFAEWVDLDENGYFDAGEDCMTKTPGVFVAGDARRKPLRQLVTAASDGAVAATAAIHYLQEA